MEYQSAAEPINSRRESFAMGKCLTVVLFLLVVGCSSLNPTYRPVGYVSTMNEFSYRDTLIKTNPDFEFYILDNAWFHRTISGLKGPYRNEQDALMVF